MAENTNYYGHCHLPFVVDYNIISYAITVILTLIIDSANFFLTAVSPIDSRLVNFQREGCKFYFSLHILI